MRSADQVKVLSYIKLNSDYANASTDEARLEQLMDQSSYEYLDEALVGVKPKIGSILVRHFGPHMVSAKLNQKIIPDKAIVEIELSDVEEIRDGDVVLVQLRDDFATCYLYRRTYAVDGGIVENFRPINPDFPVRTAVEGPGAPKTLKQQRIIIGRAIRIVYYSLED